MRRKLALVMAAAAFGLLAFGAAPAMAATLQVDDDEQQCPTAAHNEIQDAVDAANAGDTVEVCDGTYAEQVRIEGAGKDDLVLRSKVRFGAIITYPAAPESPEALVTIDGADDVTVRDFDIKGPYPAAGCAGDHIGVHVIGGSQAARVFLNRIRDIRANDSALFGCQDGFGMMVEDEGQAAIVLNDIRGYQKGGVVISGENSVGAVLGNLVAPDESVQPFIAPNGIQVSFGAVGGIVRNVVTANVCELPNDCDDFTGSGILPVEPAVGGLVIQENAVFENDDNLPLIDTDGARIEKNTINDALDLDGIFVSGANLGKSENNLIKDNKLEGNQEHDCHDDSNGFRTGGTANTWTGNQAGTANRATICPGATVDPPPQPEANRAASQPKRAKVSPAER